MDDLVKRLRSLSNYALSGYPVVLEAADRIEQQDAELDMATNVIRKQADELVELRKLKARLDSCHENGGDVFAPHRTFTMPSSLLDWLLEGQR